MKVVGVRIAESQGGMTHWSSDKEEQFIIQAYNKMESRDV